MSASRESFSLIVVLNVVLSIGVVGAAFALFGPETKSGGPAGTALTQEVEGLRRDVDALRENLGRVIEDRERLQSEVGELTARLAELEKAPRAIGGAGGLEGGELEAAARAKEPSAEERMMQGIAEMMRSQIKRERDRFIQDITNPTEASVRRQSRRIERGVRMVKDRLDLTETETEEVTRVLTEVDNMRRRSLKTLMEAKESPEDVEYKEIKKILDDSFVEEDRMISQALPTEKATEYKDSAGAFRQMIYGAAKMAFPEKKEGE